MRDLSTGRRALRSLWDMCGWYPTSIIMGSWWGLRPISHVYTETMFLTHLASFLGKYMRDLGTSIPGSLSSRNEGLSLSKISPFSENGSKGGYPFLMAAISPLLAHLLTVLWLQPEASAASLMLFPRDRKSMATSTLPVSVRSPS